MGTRAEGEDDTAVDMAESRREGAARATEGPKRSDLRSINCRSQSELAFLGGIHLVYELRLYSG